MDYVLAANDLPTMASNCGSTSGVIVGRPMGHVGRLWGDRGSADGVMWATCGVIVDRPMGYEGRPVGSTWVIVGYRDVQVADVQEVTTSHPTNEAGFWEAFGERYDPRKKSHLVRGSFAQLARCRH